MTDLGFSYPSADEEKVYQTSPNSSGWYITDATRYPNGAPDTLSMPGVPEMTYGLDPEGRTSTVSAASGQNPVTAATYSALGLTAATLGSSDTDGYTYDAGTGRMSQYQFAVDGATDTGKLGWNTNGTLASLAITDSIPGTGDTQTCNYTHDDLARLATASCGSAWSQTFGYDPFGNLTKSGTQSFSATYTNNRISGNTNYTVTYDSDGNLEDDPITGNPNSFDAEGKAVKLENVAVTFDALGRAVEAAESGGTIEFLYGPGGSKLAVMSGQTLKRADIPLPTGGEAVYTSSGLAYYRHADHLGSSRLASTSSRTLYSSTAYAPYGEAYDQAGTADKSFTGQKQDINSTASGGQYDFLMREQNPIQGRWWTPDPAGFSAVNPANPQTWNRYAYVGGVPMSLVDPTGLDACTASSKLYRVPNPNAPGIATSSGEFGPYDPGSDSAEASAAEQDGIECIDGVDVGDLLWDMMSMGGGAGGGSAEVCPEGCDNAVWVDNMDGGYWQYVEYEPFDTPDNTSGYYDPNDLANGIHDYGGAIYNDSEWQQEGNYLAYVAGQCGAVSAALAANSAGTIIGCDQTQGLKGGHENYDIPGGRTSVEDRFADGLHIECTSDRSQCWAHMDTASPYVGQFSFSGLNLGNLFVHFAVDVLWGNVGVYAFGQ